MLVDVLIVGAGVAYGLWEIDVVYVADITLTLNQSGLTVAQRLRQSSAMAGKHMLILEKSRAIGGRVATREWRIPSSTPPNTYTVAGFTDTGPQRVNWQSDAFRARLRDWASAGLLRETSDGDDVVEPSVFVPALEGGVNAWVRRAFLEEHRPEIRRLHRVARVQWDDAARLWNVEAVDESGGSDHSTMNMQCRQLVVTAPTPQARTLLETDTWVLNKGISAADRKVLTGGTTYESCYALLAHFNTSVSPTTSTGLLRLRNHERIARISSQRARGMMRTGDTLVIQATSEWSKRMYAKNGADHTYAHRALWEAAESWLKERGAEMGLREHAECMPAFEETQVKWWRYAQVQGTASRLPLKVPFAAISTDGGNLAGMVCGDAFGPPGPGIEAAYLSGMAAADAILGTAAAS